LRGAAGVITAIPPRPNGCRLRETVECENRRMQNKIVQLRPLYGYKAQYRRMLAYLAIAERDHGDTTQKEDELITFFLHCWHLKDHVKKDADAIKLKSVRDRIYDAAHASKVLEHVQKIANCSKHYSFYDTAMEGGHDLDVQLGDEHAQGKTFPLVKLPNGSSVRGIVLAKHAATEWEWILMGEGLPLM
jgi:hypothetical protein